MAPSEETQQRRRVRFAGGRGMSDGAERVPLAPIPESAYEASDYNELLSYKGAKYLARTWAPARDNAIYWSVPISNTDYQFFGQLI